jgi:hypothetical protein
MIDVGMNSKLWGYLELSKLAIEEVQICSVDRGKVSLSPRLDEYDAYFKTENPADVFMIIDECLAHTQPAWYVTLDIADFKPVEVRIVSKGTVSFEESLVRAYREKADEDEEIANEFSWTRMKLFELDDQER